MLRGSVLGSVQAALDVPQEDLDNEPDHSDAFGDADAVEGPRVIASVELAMTPGEHYHSQHSELTNLNNESFSVYRRYRARRSKAPPAITSGPYSSLSIRSTLRRRR